MVSARRSRTESEGGETELGSVEEVGILCNTAGPLALDVLLLCGYSIMPWIQVNNSLVPDVFKSGAMI